MAIGKVSDWLEDVTPLTAAPGYQWNFVDDYKTPQQLYARFEEIAQQYSDIAEIVTFKNKTNGYQRKAQATIGGTGQSAVVMSSAAWGHEGGNGITVEFVNRPGADLPLCVEVTGNAIRVLLAKNAAGALASHRGAGGGGARDAVAGPDRPRAPVPDQRRDGDRAGGGDPTALTDFLDQKRAGAPAGEVRRAARSPCARCGSASSATAPSPAC